MNTWAVLLEKIFLTIWEISWQASLIVLAVLAVQSTLGRWLNPRWKSALWLLVLIRLLLPVLPETPWSAHQLVPTPVPVEVSSVIRTTTDSLIPDSPTDVPGLNLIQALAAIWLTGVAIWGASLLWINLRFSRIIGNLPEVIHPELSLILDDSCRRLGIGRCPRMIETDRVGSPALMGLWHPTLLLPLGTASRFTPEELRLIFLHELAHLRRGDHFVQCLIAVLHVLHWFNPLLAWAFHRMRVDREPATDAMVLTWAGESKREPYGLALLKVLETYQTRHDAPLLVGILEDKSQLKSRIRLIHLFSPKAYAWSALGVGLIVVLAFFGLTRPRSDIQTITSVAPTGATATEPANIVPAMEVSQTWKQKLETTLIDLSIQDMPVDQALAEVARLSGGKGFAVEIDNKLPGSEIPRISVNLKNVSVEQALSFLCNLTDLKWIEVTDEKGGPLIRLIPKQPLAGSALPTLAQKLAKLKIPSFDADNLTLIEVFRKLERVCKITHPTESNLNFVLRVKDDPTRVSSSWRDVSLLKLLEDLKQMGALDYKIEEYCVFILSVPENTQKWKQKIMTTRIDLSVRDMPVNQAFAEVARQSAAKGFPIEIDSVLPASWVMPVSLELKETPVDEVLSYLCNLANLQMLEMSREGKDPLIQFMPKKQKEDSTVSLPGEEIRIVKVFALPPGFLTMDASTSTPSVDVAAQLEQRGIRLVQPAAATFLTKSKKLVIKATSTEIARIEAILAEFSAKHSVDVVQPKVTP